jgi:5,10-methylenetetrahydrofolate reductase
LPYVLNLPLQDIFQASPTTFSFEFFPPKTEKASEELFETIAHLQTLEPSFVSATYGAGGSTLERTHDLIVRIQRETKLTAVSHLTCVCHSEEEIAALLDRYAQSAIENILALGGDPPRTMINYERTKDAFQFADQLVSYIRSHRSSADPRTSQENLVRIAELALGARIPAPLLRSIARSEDNSKAVSKVGTHWATEQCRDLLDNQVRGIHFCTLNRSDATRHIYENLGLARH